MERILHASCMFIVIILLNCKTINADGCFYDDVYPLVIDAAEKPRGDIYTPGYEEGAYPNRAYCDYTVKAPPGYVIRLTFKVLDVEPASRCTRDKVFIFDGPSSKGDTLGAYCGIEPPSNPIITTKNGIHLSFRSDYMGQRRGFHAQYEVILPSEICPRGEVRCKNNRCYKPEQKCNGVDDCNDGTDEEECNLPLPDYECGISTIQPDESRSADRIVGGTEARPGSWPWQADLQTEGFYPNSHQCGGILLNHQWVLTAGHCLKGYPNAADWQIHLGNHNRFKRDRYEQIRYVKTLILYPGYEGKDIKGKFLDGDHDVALMKLNAPVKITDGVRPACLPKKGYEVTNGEKCFGTGWGQSRGTGSNDKLKQADMYVEDRRACPGHDSNLMICVYSRRGGVCHGDSGGPLACKIDGKYHVVGVASYVTQTNSETGLCGVAGTRNVYNKISNKIDWINEMMTKYN